MDCPHCRRSREERDEALEALRQAREDLRATRGETLSPKDFQELGFKRCEALLLVALWPCRLVDKQALYAAMFWDARDRRERCFNIVDVRLCHLRRRLRGLGIADAIETVFAAGVRLRRAARMSIEAALAAQRAARQAPSQAIGHYQKPIIK